MPLLFRPLLLLRHAPTAPSRGRIAAYYGPFASDQPGQPIPAFFSANARLLIAMRARKRFSLRATSDSLASCLRDRRLRARVS